MSETLQTLEDLVIPAGSFIRAEEGMSQDYGLEVDVSALFPDLKTQTPFVADLRLTRVPDRLLAELSESAITTTQTCVRCLTDFAFEIRIQPITREYRFSEMSEMSEKSEMHGTLHLGDIGEEADTTGYIDPSNPEVNIQLCVREEVYLNLPLLPHCQENCLGLCDQCGQNRNVTTCSCKQIKVEAEQKPFARLKDLLPDSHK